MKWIMGKESRSTPQSCKGNKATSRFYSVVQKPSFTVVFTVIYLFNFSFSTTWRFITETSVFLFSNQMKYSDFTSDWRTAKAWTISYLTIIISVQQHYRCLFTSVYSKIQISADVPGPAASALHPRLCENEQGVHIFQASMHISLWSLLLH